jgi:pimeloyl-ACP methyl ester carboxylesterase
MWRIFCVLFYLKVQCLNCINGFKFINGFPKTINRNLFGLLNQHSENIITQPEESKSYLSYSYTNRRGYGTYNTRYTFHQAKPGFNSDNNPSIIFIHGFGGNADQFRKNVPVLSEAGFDCYAIDLLGYGYSDKPSPKGGLEVNELYNFENWADQVSAFVDEVVVKKNVVLVCNSVGGVVGLQYAVSQGQSRVLGVVLIDVSLRMLHLKKQSAFIKPLVKALQTALRETILGKTFFAQVYLPIFLPIHSLILILSFPLFFPTFLSPQINFVSLFSLFFSLFCWGCGGFIVG